VAVINLKDVPVDVLRIILLTQGGVKVDRGISQFSMEQTIYKIIRDYEKLKEQEKDKK
jgi:hypothetical protein